MINHYQLLSINCLLLSVNLVLAFYTKPSCGQRYLDYYKVDNPIKLNPKMGFTLLKFRQS